MDYVDDAKTLIGSLPCDHSNAIPDGPDLNEEVNKISRWCCANSLLINPGKTKALVIGISIAPEFTGNTSY